MQNNFKTPSFFRYLAVIIYDFFLLFGLLLFITVILSFLNHGEPPKSENLLYKLSLGISILFFYHYSWKKSGQTLGMKAWKVKLINQKEQPITLTQSIIRILVAIITMTLIGIGYFWKYINKSNLTLMDVLSNTKLIYLK